MDGFGGLARIFQLGRKVATIGVHLVVKKRVLVLDLLSVIYTHQILIDGKIIKRVSHIKTDVAHQAGDKTDGIAQQ